MSTYLDVSKKSKAQISAASSLSSRLYNKIMMDFWQEGLNLETFKPFIQSKIFNFQNLYFWHFFVVEIYSIHQEGQVQ
jgi:hypothetical protein